MSLDYNLMYANTVAAHFNGGSTNYVISASNGYLYNIFVDINSDISFRKSNDNGFTWTPFRNLSGAITATQLSVWYDEWSGIPDGLIHVAYVESAADDVSYRRIETLNNDSVSAATIAFAGASTAAGATLSICRARGGNLYIVYNIDGGTEDGFATSSIDTGSTWAVGADPTEAAADYYMLLPGWNADPQDIQLIFWDTSTNELSVKRYDHSANTWAESVFSASMAELALTTGWPNFSAFPNFSGSNNIVAAWSNTDAVQSKLSCWRIDDTTVTKLTDIITGSTVNDDQGLVALTLDTSSNIWYAYYTGNSSGTDVWTSRTNVYYRSSSNFGTSWSDELIFSSHFISASNTASGADIRWLASSPIISNGQLYAAIYDNTNTTYPTLQFLTRVSTGSTQQPSQAGGSITFS